MSKYFVKLKNTKPRRQQLGRTRGVQGIRSDIDSLFVKGGPFRSTVLDTVLDGEVTRTITGASTVTLDVLDEEHRLINSSLFKRKFDAQLDGLWFRLAEASDDGDGRITFGFEARDVNRLRQQTGHVKALRDRITRAEFALLLIRELKNPRVPFFSPELHVVQPIRSRREGRRERSRQDDRREPGLDKGASITVKGAAASTEQINIIDRVLKVGVSVRAPMKVLIASIACITQESNATNLTHGDAAGPDSRGPFQQRPSMGWQGDPRDVENAALNFFKRAPTYSGGAIAYNKANPDAPMEDLINAIQVSADKSLYVQWFGEARRTISAFNGGGGSISIEREIPYAYERERNEDTWTCLGRLADEVQWSLFESNGMVYYVSQDYLIKSRVRMRIADGDPGIDRIACKYNANMRVQEVTVEGRAREWAAPPGTVTVLRGRGVSDGRYLVKEIRSNLFTEDVSVTLERRTPALPEPPAETKTITRDIPRPGGGKAGAVSGIKIRNTSPGAPHWGGTWAVFEQFIIPFMRQQGLSEWTGKRSYNTGSGTSDHWTQSTNAFAADFPTRRGEKAARAVAKALGAAYEPNAWNSSQVTIDGHKFNVQILWLAPDGTHDDHIHIGFSRA